LGRPVKWIEDRRENLIASNHARKELANVKIAFDDDGHILALGVRHLADCGAYASPAQLGVPVPIFYQMLPGPYRIPAVGFTSTTVYTNTCGRAAYRGPWQFESVVRETMLDMVARQLGLDPLEIRRRNVIQMDELPLTTATGCVYDAISPAETLEQAAAMLEYEKARAEQAIAREEGRYVGIGIALYIEPTAKAFATQSTEAAVLRVDPTGTVTVAVGCANHGQSLETTIPQVVADTLGVHVDDVLLLEGDTATSPYGGATGGSGSAVRYSGPARAASLTMREKIFEIAAHSMEAAPEDLEMVDGTVSVRGTPARSMTLGEIAVIAYTRMDLMPPGVEPGLDTVARLTPSMTETLMNSCHVALVEVDPDTGLTEIKRFITSEDCGVVINPMIVNGQIAGGVVQGIGGVLLERCVYDDDGNPLVTTFMDYLLPSAPEVPMIEHGHIVTPAKSNAGGYKGVGEGGAIGSVPAILNALADALAPLGVKITSQPCGPNELFELMHPEAEPAPVLG
jgi:carbon-monoxide dehydrogenase large subunit